uniref:Uncharacterized protein n=1 Tax=Glossina morsitans morsitans TaxID=37546 RepID=A0A1B0FFC4_GLOMM
MQMIPKASYQQLCCTSVIIEQHSFVIETFTYYCIIVLVHFVKRMKKSMESNNQHKEKSNKYNKYRRRKPEILTTWTYFKDEMLSKEWEEKQRSEQLKMDNEEARECLKQRQINCRNVLMQKKREEPIQCESFEDDGKHRQHEHLANTLKHNVTTERKFSHNREANFIPTNTNLIIAEKILFTF